MVIGKIGIQQHQATESKSSRNQPPVSKSVEKTAAESSTIDLSKAAQVVLDSKQAPIDSSKVAKIKAAIADGSYKPNPDAIASKLVSSITEAASKR